MLPDSVHAGPLRLGVPSAGSRSSARGGGPDPSSSPAASEQAWAGPRRGRGGGAARGDRGPAGTGPGGGGGGVEAGGLGPPRWGRHRPPCPVTLVGERGSRVANAAGGGDMASERDVRARLQRAGQEHLLRFCAELAPGPRAALLAELEPLEPEALREHCRNAAAACARPPGPPPGLATRLRPLPPERVGSASRSDPETRRLWEEEGRWGRGPGRGAPLAGRKGALTIERVQRRGRAWKSSVCLIFFCEVSSPLTRTSPRLGCGAPKRFQAGSRPPAAFAW